MVSNRFENSASGSSEHVHDDPGNASTEPTSSLTLAQICDIPIMSGVQVVAGESGVTGRVVRLNVMTLPDVAEWTKPQELLLTTGYPLPAETSTFVALINDLSSRGVSGLAIKLDDYTSVVPRQVIAAADDIAFPILILPRTVAIDDILSTVLTRIANDQAHSLARARDVHDSLLEASLRGNLEDILSSLSNGLGNAGVVIADHHGIVLARHLSDSDQSELIRRGVLRNGDRVSQVAAVASGSGGGSVIARRLPADDVASGHLIAIRPHHSFTPHDEMIIEQAAMVAALSISKSFAIDDVTKRFATNSLKVLLTGTDREVDELVNNSMPSDWDLNRPLQVMVGGYPADLDAKIRDRAMAVWSDIVSHEDAASAIGVLGNSLIAVVGANIDTGQTGRALVEQVTQSCGFELSIGISEEVVDASQVRSAWQHAQIASDLAHKLDSSPHIRHYETLGLIRLVSTTANEAEIEHFLEWTLGPVLALPAGDRTEMLATLHVLFELHLNVAETARVMHYHYNTIRYRVRKLEHLLGNFLENSQLALHLGVALEILPLRPQVR